MSNEVKALIPPHVIIWQAAYINCWCICILVINTIKSKVEYLYNNL